MSKFKFDWNAVKENIVDEEKSKKKSFEKDTRYWKPTVDEKGNATAIIRFLPDIEGTPFAKVYTHNFTYSIDGVKKYWIKNCINTFGYDRECPICKKNQEYWKSSFESDKAIASQRKRKLVFTSNILVIKNPNNPDEEGKIYLYNYGQKIYDKIKDKMFPSDEAKALGEGTYDEFIPFDLYEGADFKLVQVKQGEFPNYDKSEFSKQKPVGTDKMIEKVMSEVHLLSEFTAEEKFPTNEDVVTALGSILGLTKSDTKSKVTKSEVIEEDVEDLTSNPIEEDDIPDFKSDIKSNTEATSDGDEEADFFKNLR